MTKFRVYLAGGERFEIAAPTAEEARHLITMRLIRERGLGVPRITRTTVVR